jgi:menaquinol-cytochrome c reductase iron-sulfur subunit
MGQVEGLTRRTFYLASIYLLWSVIGIALAIPALVYLLFPPRARKEEEFVEAADLAQLPVQTPEEVVFRRNRVDGWKITSEKTTAWVVKLSDSDVRAYGPQCTHLGCAYHWDERKRNFLCPCHTSAFGVDGKVLSGPAPRPLDRYELKLQGSKLLLGGIREVEG